MRILLGLGLCVVIIYTFIGCAHKEVVENSTDVVLSPETSENEKFHEVIVSQVIVDQSIQGEAVPVIILVNKDDNKQFLPIWIGANEALSINKVLNHLTSPRPGTHDLFADVLGQFHVELVKVVITDLRDNTYFAVMTVELNGEIKEIDARPSDAIALALRSMAPVFVSERVISKGGWTKILEKPETQPKRQRRRREETDEEENLL